MTRQILLFLATLATPAVGQSFTCNYGSRAACLDYGDTVCSSVGKCVDANAACFASYQCNYEGFTCKSNVTACVDEYEDLLQKHNQMVRDYNDLLDDYKALQGMLDDTRRCVEWATSLADAQYCF